MWTEPGTTCSQQHEQFVFPRGISSPISPAATATDKTLEKENEIVYETVGVDPVTEVDA